jgi:hypothetical protein
MKIREGVQLDREAFALEKKELEAVFESGVFAVSSNASCCDSFARDTSITPRTA